MTIVSLHVTGLDPDGRRVAALVDGGFDDATITQARAGGRGAIEVEVDATPLDPRLVGELITRAEAVDGVHVEGVGPSPLVNAADVAERLGRTRQSIGQLATGLRGPGGWPAPLNPGARAPIWEWADVADWANHHLDARIPDHEITTARVLARVNTELRANLHRSATA